MACVARERIICRELKKQKQAKFPSMAGAKKERGSLSKESSPLIERI